MGEQMPPRWWHAHRVSILAFGLLMPLLWAQDAAADRDRAVVGRYPGVKCNGQCVAAFSERQDFIFEPCLPPGFTASTPNGYDNPGMPSQNVRETLGQLLQSKGAYCTESGLLVSASGEAIAIYQRQACWGSPPPNYLQLQADERRMIQELQSSYDLVVIPCPPRQ